MYNNYNNNKQKQLWTYWRNCLFSECSVFPDFLEQYINLNTGILQVLFILFFSNVDISSLKHDAEFYGIKPLGKSPCTFTCWCVIYHLQLVICSIAFVMSCPSSTAFKLFFVFQIYSSEFEHHVIGVLKLISYVLVITLISFHPPMGKNEHKITSVDSIVRCKLKG